MNKEFDKSLAYITKLPLVWTISPWKICDYPKENLKQIYQSMCAQNKSSM